MVRRVNSLSNCNEIQWPGQMWCENHGTLTQELENLSDITYRPVPPRYALKPRHQDAPSYPSASDLQTPCQLP
jgi:hypothetical protein